MLASFKFQIGQTFCFNSQGENIDLIVEAWTSGFFLTNKFIGGTRTAVGQFENRRRRISYKLLSENTVDTPPEIDLEIFHQPPISTKDDELVCVFTPLSHSLLFFPFLHVL